MERAISEMEKIRRAEEIYSKRKNLQDGKEIDAYSNKKKGMYKILFQVLILLNISIIIVAIQNKDYIFTENFLNQINSYNINIKDKFESWLTYKKNENSLENDAPKAEVTENKEENNSQDTNPEVQGALVENDAPKELSQMELDVKTIKEKYSIISPVNGTKTSGFGERESSNSKVTSNHTGVDIANVKGTVIKSAISGTVTQVSSEGDYGKHLRVTIDNLTTLYAHCSKIYVKEGDSILQGQDIAEIGNTGNSTGPHLHFEIRYEERFVDPEMIIQI